MPARIITLLTDFGCQDPFVGIIKGVILSLNPKVQLVDLSHSITPGDILSAAFSLKQSYPFFPKNTIHLAVIDPGVGGKRKALLLKVDDHFFVGPDNGLFSLITQENKYRAFALNKKNFHLKEVSQTFHGRDIFAPVAAHLSLGVPPEKLGKEFSPIRKLKFPQIKQSKNLIKGEIIYIDHFGNLISNIPSKLLLKKTVQKIKIKGKTIRGLSACYSEKKPGELLALLNSFSYLEIAANLENAFKRLNAPPGTPIEIELAE